MTTRRNARPGLDQAQMRAANLSLVLRALRLGSAMSRATLATATGLSRPAISGLVTELVERGLAREDGLQRRGTVGRPGTGVVLDGSGVVGVGLEVAADRLTMVSSRLSGTTCETHVPLGCNPSDVDAVADAVVQLLRIELTRAEDAGQLVAGVTLCATGALEESIGLVRFSSATGWRDVALLDLVRERLGADCPSLRLEHDARIAAVAEHGLSVHEDVDHLVRVNGGIGVGAGIITDGKLMRGGHGTSGEVGHLPLGPEGASCGCGRIGCWELAVGLPAFLSRSQADPLAPVDEALAEVFARASRGDTEVLEALQAVGDSLSRGLSILCDVVDPQVVVLGGWFAHLPEALISQIEGSLATRAIPGSQTPRIVTSGLGRRAAALGGALMALERVLADPTLAPVIDPAVDGDGTLQVRSLR